MTRPRKALIAVEDTPYYIITSRCVRRTYLCGKDKSTGKSYEHRRQWIEDRIRILASIYALDVCSYAVMSNHYHIVVKLRPEILEEESDREILNRWSCLHKLPFLVEKYYRNQTLGKAEQTVVDKIIDDYRERLGGISWFMKSLNQFIARQANIEDKCTGHFWEGRFNSKALNNR